MHEHILVGNITFKITQIIAGIKIQKTYLYDTLHTCLTNNSIIGRLTINA